jgi:hypothetical protein
MISTPLLWGLVLRHSIFTNNQDVLIGQSGGKVRLDSAGDELDTKTIVAELEEETDPQTGETRLISREERLLTEQITVDTGASGPGNIQFLGEVDIPVPLRNPSVVVTVEKTITSQDTSSFCTSPICYVSLHLSAGTGSISFPGGIATRANPAIPENPNPGIPIDQVPIDNPDQIQGSTNTVDLRIDSGASVTVGPDSFVNSFCFKSDCDATVLNLTKIHHETINLQVRDGTQPPIFPEPQLPARGSPTLGGRAIGQALAVDIVPSTVEETQRQKDAACEEGAAARGGEGKGAGDGCASTAEVEDLYVFESISGQASQRKSNKSRNRAKQLRNIR